MIQGTYIVVALLVYFWLKGKQTMNPPRDLKGRYTRKRTWWDGPAWLFALVWPVFFAAALALYAPSGLGNRRKIREFERHKADVSAVNQERYRLRRLRDEALAFANLTPWAHPVTHATYVELAAVWSHELGEATPDAPDFDEKVRLAREAGYDVDFAGHLEDPDMRQLFSNWYDQYVHVEVSSADELRAEGVKVTRRVR